MSSTENETATKIVIVGGVAGGASAAARARRLAEDARIIVFERGPYASFANCGLPYYVGGEIDARGKLLVAGSMQLEGWLGLDLRTETEVVSIDRQAKTVTARELESGREYTESYDFLILAPGAAPLRPAGLMQHVGADHPRVLSLRNVPDVDRIKQVVDDGARRAVVVGGGFIGVEMAEQLVHRGVQTTLVEMLPQVMPPLDAEMATPVHQALTRGGVDLRLDTRVDQLQPSDDAQVTVVLSDGDRLQVDLVLLAIGVQPESSLAKAAGLEVNERGAIRVDDYMRTSDPSIYAVGDAIEVVDAVLGGKTQIPLAGPANRQGRLAADHILAARSGAAPDGIRFRGSQGTSIVRAFDLSAATTGVNEKTLIAQGKRLHEDYEVAFDHSFSHASYYPGAARIHFKLLLERPSGRVLGAQIVAGEGVDKRIDVLAMAIQMRATVFDLEQAELAYAPPFGSAKDPINQAAFQAANMLRGTMKPITARELAELAEIAALPDAESVMLLDVRTSTEFDAGALPGAVNVPLHQLRDRICELTPDWPTVVYCGVGLRGYLAEQILRQRGFTCVSNLIGGMMTYKNCFPPETKAAPAGNTCAGTNAASGCQSSPATTDAASGAETLDARGLQCPGPLLAVAERVGAMQPGQSVRVLATDPGFAVDVEAWCAKQGHTLVSSGPCGDHYQATIAVGAAPSAVAEASPQRNDGQTIVVFSGDLDRVLAAFVLANAGAAMGNRVTLFFTFWGLNALRKDNPPAVSKGLIDRMFGAMMPRGAEQLKLSKMNMAGMGTAMMKRVMSNKNVDSLPELIAKAQQAGVRLVACTMSMDVMGLQGDELIDGVDFGGAAAYLGAADQAGVNLFI